MAFSCRSQLTYVTILILASHLEFASARLRVWAIQGRGLKGDPAGNPPDPYVKIWCSSTFGGMTEFYKNTANPTWHAQFFFPNGKVNDNLKLEVWDKDLNFDDKLGTCTKLVKRGFNRVNCSLKKGTVSFNYELV